MFGNKYQSILSLCLCREKNEKSFPEISTKTFKNLENHPKNHISTNGQRKRSSFPYYVCIKHHGTAGLLTVQILSGSKSDFTGL